MSSVPELATRYAALVALTDAIVGEKTKASAELRAALWAQGLTKGAVTTPLGPLTLRENKATTTVGVADEDALIGWCEANHPDALEHITRVRAADREHILSGRFVPVAGQVIDSLSGEVVEFAHVVTREASAPTPSYGASELQREVKRAAAEIAAMRAGPLCEALTITIRELDPPEYDPMDGE
jgi:hypothetical protein